MYAVVTRRTMNPTNMDETRARAKSEFFPKRRQAPGFVSLTLIRGESGANTVIILWESQERQA